MTTTADDAVDDPRAALAALRERFQAAEAERDAAGARETALAEILALINRTPGDPGPVFEAILENAMRLCESAHGILSTFDGVQFHTVATYGVIPGHWYVPGGTWSPVEGAASGRLVAGEDVVHSLDSRELPAHLAAIPNIRVYIEDIGARSSLWVALRNKEALVGILTIFRQEVRPYTEQQIALMRNFAAQAVIAMENARLITEQREALDRQTALAEVMQIINASPGELEPVFQAMVDRTMRLCDATAGTLFIVDGDTVPLRSQRNLPDAFVEYLAREPPSLDAGSLLARSIRDCTPINVADLKEAPPYRAGVSLAVAAVDLGLIRSIAWVPLVHAGTALGLFAISRREVRPFTARQMALLEDFAGQATIAMANARLLTEQREALEQQTATAEVLQVINASPGDLAPVFDSMLEKAMRLCEGAFGILNTYDGEHFRTVATRGIPGAFIEYRAQNPLVPAPGGFIARLLETRRPVHILDLMAGESYQTGHPTTRALVDLGGARTDLVVPLVKDDAVLGFIAIYRVVVEAFSDKQIALLENFAAQAVIAMENARLIDEIRAARDHAEATLRDLRIAQANLVQAEKMASLGQLTAGIAHEIKNPLNFINNFAILAIDLLTELLETAAPGFATLPEDQRADIEDLRATLVSNLEKITHHGKRADNIVKSMLEHSRGASGERRIVDLNALAEDALNLAYHGARAQDEKFNVTLERHFGENIAPIELNPQDVSRVLLNLFGNGFYATNKRAKDSAEPGFEPTLSIATADLGDAVELRVRDNGTGVPAAIKDKLFEPFFTTKPTGEGTGLGLSITYDIVTAQHGGSITVDSEEGGWTEFTIRLPRVR